jgi:N-hydroxyarylamine O-acetyltransferase
VVGGEGLTNHMALLVWLDGEAWVADPGLGEGFLDPLPLRPGAYPIGPFTYSLRMEPGGTWWMGQHQWGSVRGFRMAVASSSLCDFEPHHHRLAHDPDSPFVRTLVAQQPREDRIVTLRARTLTEYGPTVDSRHVVSDMDEFASVLAGVFGLHMGGSRLERCWMLAVAQHESFAERVAG